MRCGAAAVGGNARRPRRHGVRSDVVMCPRARSWCLPLPLLSMLRRRCPARGVWRWARNLVRLHEMVPGMHRRKTPAAPEGAAVAS